MRRSPIARLLRSMQSTMLKRTPMMITCREFDEFIDAYLDRELPPRQRRVFELHLKICRNCRAYLDAYRCTIEVAKRVVDDLDRPVPDEVPEEFIKAILAAKDT